MSVLDDLLNSPAASRVRRNHGLEHATLNILSTRFPHKSMAGHSDRGGFWILGNVPTQDLETAVGEALARMQAGERGLAIHPNCGTNFVASGMLAGLVAWGAMLGGGKSLREKLDRLPTVISLVTLALIFGQPLGPMLQARVTTSGIPGNLKVVKVIPDTRSGMQAHRVVTEG